MRLPVILAVSYFALLSCNGPTPSDYTSLTATDTVKDDAGRKTVILAPTDGTADMNTINTGATTPQQLVAFARTAIGVPYKYASADPQAGFDCSGFITYTFNHFGIAVPRASVDFTDVKHEVELQKARQGDLILFTGTDSTVRVVGHMGIVVSNQGQPVEFIHSTSGKAMGVTISPLNTGYMDRFVKVIRIFSESESR